MVSGSTPKAERDAQIQAFRRGQIRCLVNVAVLTTGFDVPEVDFIALLRPTKSPVLYVQIAGRGMRIAPGKTDCMWADFTDTTSRMGPVDMVKGRPPIKAVSTEAPTKLCPGCGKRCATAALVCPFCGYPFDPPDRIKHDTQSSGAPVLSTQIQRTIVRYDVSDVQYYRHSKAGSPDSLLVEYMDGLMPACKEWVCLEHSGYARQKAVGWWRSRRLSTETPLPETVDDALEWIDYSVKNDVPLLERPIAVSVDESGKYPVIVGFEW
jgi:DNA repair protein RadD